MPTDSRPAPTKSVSTWLVAGVLLAVVFQSLVVSLSPAIARDGITFIQIAQACCDDPTGTMQSVDQHPGYPAMILAGRWLVSPLVDAGGIFSWIWGARLASGLFGVLTLVAVWLVARRIFNETTAGIAVIYVAVLPVFRLNAADALSDTPHLFFYLLATWLAVEGLVRKRWVWFLGAGASAGVAYWVRPEGLSVVIVTAAVLPLWAWRRRDMTVRTVVLFLVVMVLTTVVVVSPYCMISGKLTSKATTKPYLSPPQNAGALPTGGFSSAGVLDVLALEQTDPGERSVWGLLCDGVVELAIKGGQSLRWVVVLPLVLGLVIGGCSRSDPRGRALIAGLLLLHLALLAWVYYAGRYMSQRHLMPPLALLMPWVAWGTELFAHGVCRLIGIREPEKLRLARPVVVAVLLLPLVISMVPRMLSPIHADEVPLIETSLVLGQQAKEGDRVITNSKYVLFYSRVPGSYIGRLAPEPVLRPSQAGPPFRFVVINLQTDPLPPEWEEVFESKYTSKQFLGIRAKGVRTLILR